MERLASSNIAAVGLWSPTTVSNLAEIRALNRTSIDVTMDQMRQLYMMLYPFINSDFKHRDDLVMFSNQLRAELNQIINSFNSQLKTMISQINNNFNVVKQTYATHTHVCSAPGSPTAPPVTQVVTANISAPQMKITDLKKNSEYRDYTKGGDNHIGKVFAGKSYYFSRDNKANKNVIPTVTPPITVMLQMPGVFTPFDIGGEDSLIAGSGLNQVKSRKV